MTEIGPSSRAVMDSNNHIVEMRNVSVSFDMERGSAKVLDNISLDIYNNEIIGIVGGSGSGKSMLASALLDAVVEPGVLSGDVVYNLDGNGIDITTLSDDKMKQLRWEVFSMVQQGAMDSFNPTMKIESHFKETLEAHDVAVKSGMEHAKELLSDLYLDPTRTLESYPHELSGGMKQRTLIALSLLLEPDVLVMDEPTSALDLLMQRSILSLIDKIKDKYDLTIVFVTHNLPLVSELADRVAVMYAFEIVEINKTSEIFESPVHPYTRGLINSIPDMNTPISEIDIIEGDSPDPVDVPEGCSYYPRCPISDQVCTENDPELSSITEDGTVACHYPEKSQREILTTSDKKCSVDNKSDDREDLDRKNELITLEDFSIYFKNRGSLVEYLNKESPKSVQAVDQINLEIYENDIVTLVGESGCGKTTLGKGVVAAERPTGGNIRYRNQDIWEAKDRSGNVQIPFEEIRRALQIIHQDPGSSLNPNRTIERSLLLPLNEWRSDLSRSEKLQRIYTMLERVGMKPVEDYAKRYPHQLSGGEKQRVALVRALLMNPDLIFADEAISALDVSLRVEMMDLLIELQEEFDTSYLYITHNLSNARYITTSLNGRIGIMYLGEIVEIGPAKEVIEDPQHPYTQALKQATSVSDSTTEKTDQPPVESIDIPDPIDPPSGCRFHTRCPYAREICSSEDPELRSKKGDSGHHTACFRTDNNHPYWDSEELERGNNRDV